MQKLHYLESHVGSIEGCITLGNRFGWNITVEEHHGRWWVNGGDQPMFSSDSREALDAFLYGLGLAYSTIPEDFIEGIHKRKHPDR